MCDEVFGSGKFGGDGHEADMTFRGLPKLIEEWDGWWFEEGIAMDAALDVGEEWAFQMDAEGDCACGWVGVAGDEAGEAAEGAERVLAGRG